MRPRCLPGASFPSAQQNVQALRAALACRLCQLLSGFLAQLQPADDRMATPQAQGFASQFQRALRAARLQEQDAFAIEAGLP
ncbi:hypothetical protein D3C81_1567600 [compost metagenome]